MKKDIGLKNEDFIVYEGGCISNSVKLRIYDIIKNLDNGLMVLPTNKIFNIWSNEKTGYILMGLVRGFPFPSIYGYRNKDSVIEIVSGGEYILNVYLYFKGKSPEVDFIELKKERNIRLIDSLSRLYKMRNSSTMVSIQKDDKIEEINIDYDNLTKEQRNTFDKISVNVTEIKATGSNKYLILYKAFRNLTYNELSEQELRSILYLDYKNINISN